MMMQLIYSRAIQPCPKSKTVNRIFLFLFDNVSISEAQIYDEMFFIGNFYEKYIELFNIQYEKLFPRNFDTCFFDYTNYYFEIDLPKEDKQKGTSKENQHSPIIG